MSKSILVIDTPTSCGLCPCFLEVATDCCGVTGKEVNASEKSKFCPLKEVHKTSVGIEVCIGNQTECVQSYVDGYNACIDEILKECD